MTQVRVIQKGDWSNMGQLRNEDADEWIVWDGLKISSCRGKTLLLCKFLSKLKNIVVSRC